MMIVRQLLKLFEVLVSETVKVWNAFGIMKKTDRRTIFERFASEFVKILRMCHETQERKEPTILVWVILTFLTALNIETGTKQQQVRSLNK